MNLNAQDLEPRNLSAVPIATNFGGISYSYSSGNILLDPAIPIDDLNASLNSFVIGYARSFKVFDKLTKIDAVLPYSFAHFEGIVNNLDSATNRTGFGDPLLRLSMILIGVKPERINNFNSQQNQRFRLGFTFRLRLPFGTYYPDKLINLGSNRFAFKTGISASYEIIKNLILEAQTNIWFFTKNNDFFNGNSLKQKPLLSGQIHTTYIFNPRFWIALSFGQSALGETLINDIEKKDPKISSRLGAAVAYKLTKKSAIKFALTDGITTKYGANFTTILLGYQYMWF